MGAIQKWSRRDIQCFASYIWFSSNGMRKLGDRTSQCKPLIPKIKTDVSPLKRTRMSDVGENHFRIGAFDLFPDSDDNDEYRVWPNALFPNPDESSVSGNQCIASMILIQFV